MFPVSEDFIKAMFTSHRAISWVEILGVDEPIDGVVSGAVTIDAEAMVMGKFDMTILDPDGVYLETNSPTDILTRFGSEVRPWRGVIHADGAIEAVPLGTFRVDTNDPVEVGDGYQLSISARDRSSIVARPAPRPIAIAANTPVHEAIARIILSMDPSASFDFLVTPYTTNAMLIEVGVDPWAQAVDLATAAGLSLYPNRWGVYTLNLPLSSEDMVSWVFSQGENSTLTDAPQIRTGATTTLANGYIVMSSNTAGDSATIRAEAWDEDPYSPTYRYGRYGEVVEIIQSDQITSTLQAQAAANLLLRRKIGTVNQIEFSCVPNPALDIFDTVWMRRPQVGVDGGFWISTLTIPLNVEEAMTGTVRNHPDPTEEAISNLIAALMQRNETSSSGSESGSPGVDPTSDDMSGEADPASVYETIGEFWGSMDFSGEMGTDDHTPEYMRPVIKKRNMDEQFPDGKPHPPGWKPPKKPRKPLPPRRPGGEPGAKPQRPRATAQDKAYEAWDQSHPTGEPMPEVD